MTQRLHAVPDHPVRTLGLIRVSLERDDMVSPDIQLDSISDYSRQSGYTLGSLLVGIDESGSRANSAWWATLDRAVALVETGQVDVIVVWKFSRFARHRLRWELALNRVEQAGGRLESATERVDTSTSTGQFTRGMLAEIAAWEAKRIGEGWREAHQRRTAAGIPHSGRNRFGYVKIDGQFTPCPDTGPILADMYRRYLAGESFRTIAWWLNRTGTPTTPGYKHSVINAGEPWAAQSVRRILDAGFGAGLITVHGEQRPGAHPSVIDAETWRAYLAQRRARRGHARTEPSVYLLSGMVRCGICQSRMSADRRPGGRQPRWRCSAADVRGRHRGQGWSIPMAPVDAALLDWLGEVADETNQAADAAAEHHRFVERRKQTAADLEAKIATLDRSLTELTVHLASHLVPESAYAAARDTITAQRDALADQLLAAQVDATPREPPARIAAHLLEHWHAYSVEKRRGMLRELLDHVTAAPGTEPRFTPRWHGRS